MRPLNQYKQSFHKAFPIDDPQSEASAIRVHTWYTASGRTEFVQAFKHETGLSISRANRSEKALVEQGYPKNINEYDGKTAWDQYYIANGLIVLRELDKILGKKTSMPVGQVEIFYGNIIRLAHKLFLDTLILIDDWATYKQQLPDMIGVGKVRYENTMAIYQSALQVIYGNHSPFAFSDNHSDTATNQFRMAIEIRLRRGFGIVAKLDFAGAMVPLALSEIISAIRPLKKEIIFAVPFEQIERLYGWANIYMHSGLKQYTWSPIYALTYLHPFFVGNGGSVNSGITAKRGVVKQVQEAVKAGIDKTRYTLIVNDPTECDLILE